VNDVLSLLRRWLGCEGSALAAGAIKPKDGFRYAFENGADLFCVGMYDFQMVANVNTALDVLQSNLQRARLARRTTQPGSLGIGSSGDRRGGE
jgi:hypothetical protein